MQRFKLKAHRLTGMNSKKDFVNSESFCPWDSTPCIFFIVHLTKLNQEKVESFAASMRFILISSTGHEHEIQLEFILPLSISSGGFQSLTTFYNLVLLSLKELLNREANILIASMNAGTQNGAQPWHLANMVVREL